MTYLLAKYALLFLLTAFLGFVLGYWFSRRNLEDVTESFEDMRKANARSDETQWNKLWQQFDALPEPKETDLSSVFERIDGVQNLVSGLPRPEPVNLASVEERLDSLTDTVRRIPVPEKPAAVNLAPVTGKLERLEEAVRKMPRPEPQPAVDLRPVRSEVSTLRDEIKQIPVVKTNPPVDLAPISTQIRSLEQRVKEFSRPESVDLKPFDRRLQGIEKEIGGLRKRLAKPLATAPAPEKRARKAAASKATPQTVRKGTREEPRILSAALYGTKDDLKQISGVGPKLERLLNQNGVFYFWQVAEWKKPDIDVIDRRLDTFKGRIGRDDWVSQAKRLCRDPGAARMPANP